MEGSSVEESREERNVVGEVLNIFSDLQKVFESEQDIREVIIILELA